MRIPKLKKEQKLFMWRTDSGDTYLHFKINNTAEIRLGNFKISDFEKYMNLKKQKTDWLKENISNDDEKIKEFRRSCKRFKIFKTIQTNDLILMPSINKIKGGTNQTYCIGLVEKKSTYNKEDSLIVKVEIKLIVEDEEKSYTSWGQFRSFLGNGAIYQITDVSEFLTEGFGIYYDEKYEKFMVPILINRSQKFESNKLTIRDLQVILENVIKEYKISEDETLEIDIHSPGKILIATVALTMNIGEEVVQYSSSNADLHTISIEEIQGIS